MRVFTFSLLVLTIVVGILAYYGLGALTEIVRLTYAYLALSTVACGLITLAMPRETANRAGSGSQVEQS